MGKHMYGVTVYHSDDLKGLTGDKDEKFCVFINNYSDPVNSAWAWYHEEYDAKEFATNIRKKLKEESDGT